MTTSRDDSAILIIAAVVLLLLLGGGFLFLTQRASAFRAMALAEQARAAEMQARVRAETARAEAESQRAAPVPGLPSDSPAEPDKKPDQTVALREALDQAAAKLEDGSLKDNPAAAASIHSALGQSYFSLGDLDAAEKHFKAALDLHIKALGEADPSIAADRDNLDKVARARAK